MVYSMTGYGHVVGQFEDKEIIVEIRCLNSKVNDFRMKIPNLYKQKELDIRKILNDTIVRGKLDVTITVASPTGEDEYTLDKNMIQSLHRQILNLGIDLSNTDILNAILKFPNVITSNESVINDEEFAYVTKLLQEAIVKLNEFRSIEGITIETDMNLRIDLILKALVAIEVFDQDRISLLKEKMMKSLTANFSSENIDKNRFEQELLYYLERLDITEEKVRLKQHCDYFLQEVANDQVSKSKKLKFITQEIGREINTLGAKAQHSSIQKIVVGMKDELEKIKEQLANIL